MFFILKKKNLTFGEKLRQKWNVNFLHILGILICGIILGALLHQYYLQQPEEETTDIILTYVLYIFDLNRDFNFMCNKLYNNQNDLQQTRKFKRIFSSL